MRNSPAIPEEVLKVPEQRSPVAHGGLRLEQGTSVRGREMEGGTPVPHALPAARGSGWEVEELEMKE